MGFHDKTRLKSENKIKAPTRWHCVTLQVQAFVQS